jgi:hypothetical protein
MQNKSFQVGIFIGALLIAGLFYFQRSTRSEQSSPRLKPSQMDFSKSNQLPAAPLQKPTTQQQVELSQANPLKAEDEKKWKAFEEILNSKNDNDPRVDEELRHLSPQMHDNLRKAYSHLPPENRNGRGFIAFLIARDLKDSNDVQFLQEIYQEPPCQSLQNCAEAAAADPHFDGINATSLNYPQLASLYQLQKRLEADPSVLESPEMRNSISQTLREARQFPSSAVQNRAQQIQEKFGL